MHRAALGERRDSSSILTEGRQIIWVWKRAGGIGGKKER